jgi:hypothetical protein
MSGNDTKAGNDIDDTNIVRNAKRRYEEAGIDLDVARNDVLKWKKNHTDADGQYSILDPELLHLEKLVNDANQRLKEARQGLQDFEQLWQNARAATLPPSTMLLTQPLDPTILSTYVTLAQEISFEESGRLYGSVPKQIFLTDCSNGLFIRQEYLDVANIIENRFVKDPSRVKVLVVGSPGIGKSVFGVLLFLLALKRKKNVAYHLDGKEYVCFFTWNQTEYNISFLPCIGKVYEGYFDGKESSFALDFVLFSRVFLFSSPRTTNFLTFPKDKCFTVYLNPWSKQECAKFAEIRKCEDPEEQWENKFNLVGGKPRFIFSRDEYEELHKRLEKAIPIDGNELECEVRNCCADVFSETMKHIAYSIYRDELLPSSYCLIYSSVASETIMSARFITNTADTIRNLLQTPAANLQSWRGRDIEKFLLQDIATEMFRVKSLEGTNVGTIENYGPFNALSYSIYGASDIQKELFLNIPLSKNFPSVDGVLVVPKDSLIIYIQCTVSKRHPVQYTALKNLYNNLIKRNDFQGYKHMLLFVVSDDVFDDFCFQPYKNIVAINDRKQKIGIDIEQFVARKIGRMSS